MSYLYTQLEFSKLGKIGPRIFRAIVLPAVLSLCAVFGEAHAHADGENYIWLKVESDHVSGHVELNVKDISSKLGVKFDLSDQSAESIQDIADVQSYIKNNFKLFDGSEELAYTLGETKTYEEKVEIIQFYFSTTSIPSDQVLRIKNTIFLDGTSDKLHKSLVLLEYNKSVDKYFAAENVVLIFDTRKQEQELDLVNPPSYHPWMDFFRQGILHIVYGFDHVLFVVTLLLTSAITYSRADGWTPISNWKTTLWNVFKVLTVFTIAHSITLTLSVLGLINVNIWLVEMIIVLSILVMALNNLRPVFPHNSVLIVFVFGLFHGVGFASVMNQLAFRNVFIERVVLFFNLGIEFGQLLIALLIVPVVYFLSRLTAYRKRGMQLVSFCISLIAVYWLVERSGVIQ